MSNAICLACALTRPEDPREARALGVCGTHYQQASRSGFIIEHPGSHPCARCLADKAEKIRPIKTRGRCQPHYRQGLASGELAPAYAPRGSQKDCTECAKEGRVEKAKAHGLCNSHLGRAYRGSDTSGPIRQAKPERCSGPECDNDTETGRGDLCAGHNSQKKRGKPLTPLRSYKPRGGPCGVTTHKCPHEAKNDGLCNRHYQLRAAGGKDWDRPIKAKAKNGTGHVDKNGYRVIYRNGKVKREHVAFMEDLLERELQPGESVHHLNGNRADNRTDGPLQLVHGKLRSGNLELWSSAQPAGQEIGPKLDWAIEMQEEYEPYLTDGYLARMAAVLERRGYAVGRAA